MITSASASSSLKGIACMVGDGALVMMNNAIVKLLTDTVPVGQILFVRGLSFSSPSPFSPGGPAASAPCASRAWRARRGARC